jgi:Flp pilus assembly pilin Flp
MKTLYNQIRKSLRGQTATEYVLAAALIAVVLYSLYTTLTGSTS